MEQNRIEKSARGGLQQFIGTSGRSLRRREKIAGAFRHPEDALRRRVRSEQGLRLRPPRPHGANFRQGDDARVHAANKSSCFGAGLKRVARLSDSSARPGVQSRATTKGKAFLRETVKRDRSARLRA